MNSNIWVMTCSSVFLLALDYNVDNSSTFTITYTAWFTSSDSLSQIICWPNVTLCIKVFYVFTALSPVHSQHNIPVYKEMKTCYRGISAGWTEKRKMRCGKGKSRFIDFLIDGCTQPPEAFCKNKTKQKKKKKKSHCSMLYLFCW